MAAKSEAERQKAWEAVETLKKEHPEMFNEKGELFADDKADNLAAVLNDRLKSGEENPSFTLHLAPQYDPRDSSKTSPDAKTYVFSLDPDTRNLRVEDLETGRDLTDDPQAFREFLDEHVQTVWLVQQEMDYLDLGDPEKQEELEDPDKSENYITDKNSPYRQRKGQIGDLMNKVKKTGESASYTYFRDGITHHVTISPEFGNKNKNRQRGNQTQDQDNPYRMGKSGVKIVDSWTDKEGAKHSKVIDTNTADRLYVRSYRARMVKGAFWTALWKPGKIAARGALAYGRKVAREISAPEAGFSRM